MVIDSYEHKAKFSQSEFFDSPGPRDVPNKLLMGSFQKRSKNSGEDVVSDINVLSSTRMPAESSIQMKADKISRKMGDEIENYQDVESGVFSWLQKFLVFSAAFVAILLLVMVGLGLHYNHSLDEEGRVAGEDSIKVIEQRFGQVQAVYEMGEVADFDQLSLQVEVFRGVEASDYLILLEDEALIYRASEDLVIKEIQRE